MDYIIDIAVLLVSYILSWSVVTRNRTLNNILIPVPDGGFNFGRNVRFKFIKYKNSKQEEGGYLLMLLIFIFLAFLGKVLLLGAQNDEHTWLTFWIGYGVLVLFQLLSTFNIVILLFFGLLYGIPWLIGTLIFDGSFAFGGDSVKWIGLIAGIIPGIYGGFFFGRSFFLAKTRMKKEAQAGETLSGVTISGFGKLRRHFNSRWMAIAPVFTFFAIVSFFTASESYISGWIAELSEVLSIVAIVIWVLVSLNIFIFTVPMIIEMIQQGTWYSAGLFNSEVLAGKEENVKRAYLDSKGEYNAFNFGSTFVIGIIVFSVGFSIAGDVVGKLVNVNINQLGDNTMLTYFGVLISGFLCALNIGVLLSILSHSHTKVLFTIRDIKLPGQLIEKILRSEDKVSEFVRDSASVTSVRLIEKHKESSFMGKTYVSNLFNEIIMKCTVFNAERFEEVEIDAETRQLIDDNPVEDELVLLNRKLLELVYSEELGIFKVEERMKSAKENISLMSKLMKDEDLSVNITSGKGFYVNIQKAQDVSLDDALKIPETMRVPEVEPDNDTGKP